jgi:hydrogenase maturation factor
MEEASQICIEYGMHIIGGHTEVSKNVTDIIVTATALSGENRAKEKIKDVTDYDIVISGYIGMEAAGLIATQKVGFLISSCEDYTKIIVFLLVTRKVVCYNQTKQKGAIL